MYENMRWTSYVLLLAAAATHRFVIIVAVVRHRVKVVEQVARPLIADCARQAIRVAAAAAVY